MPIKNNRLPVRVAPISALLLSLFLFSVGNGLQGTLIAVRAGIEGIDQEYIGIIMSSYFVGYILGTLVTPGYILRVGHIRTFAALASVASAATLAHILLIDALSWSVFRAISGLCIAGLGVVIESWMNSHAAPGNRGKILSLYGALTMFAIAAGQLLLTLASPDSFVLFCLISILISLALVPVSLSSKSAPTVSTSTRINPGYLYRTAPLGIVGTFLTGVTMGSFIGMGPVYGQQIGLDASQIAFFMLAMMLGALLLQMPLGWISDRTDRRRVIVLAAAANVLISIAFIQAADASMLVLFVMALLLGGFGQPLYSLCVAHANDTVSEDQMVSTASTLLLVFGAGSALGPLVSSQLMGYFGSKGLFICLIVFYLLILLPGCFQIIRRKAISQEAMAGNFVSTYSTTAIGLGMELDESQTKKTQ